jgi:copper homeostasis protein
VSFLLEIAVQSVEAAVAAKEAGADRIELCANLSDGGVTPSLEMMERARVALKIPIFSMIRPRTGNFAYGEKEFAAMRDQIAQAKRARLDGVVLGILTAGNEIDVARTSQLIAEAKPLPVTFHRAFDDAGATTALLEQVIATGATRLLTSGGAKGAPEAASRIHELIRRANGRIIVMPGAGINAQNFPDLRRATGASEFHAGLGSVQPYGSPEFSRFSAEIRSIAAQKSSRA